MSTSDRAGDPPAYDPYQTGDIPALRRNVWRIARRPHDGVNRWREIRRILRIEWRQFRRDHL